MPLSTVEKTFLFNNNLRSMAKHILSLTCVCREKWMKNKLFYCTKNILKKQLFLNILSYLISKLIKRFTWAKGT